MHDRQGALGLLAAALAISLGAATVSAQVENALSAYTGVNAKAYMQPIADAFGADLNSAFFHSAHIPASGTRVSFGIAVMGVIFSDEDKTFMGRTEGGFMPDTSVAVPTIAGSGESVTVTGVGGTSFTFPGGFDLNSFGLAVPQLRIGAVKGTEAVIRFFAADVGDNEIAKIDLFGIGARHSLSQYFELPVDLAVGAMWQSFSMGDDFIDSNAFTVGVQSSKRFGLFEPYGGLSYDYFKMDLAFDSDVAGAAINVDFDAYTSLRLTLGLALNFMLGHAFAEFDVASTSSFAFGLVVGK